MKYSELNLGPDDKLVVTLSPNLDPRITVDVRTIDRAVERWRSTDSDLIIPWYIKLTVVRGLTADTPIEVVVK